MADNPTDTSPGRHCVTAVFDHEADARKAKADLLALGFAAEDIEIKSAAVHAVAPERPAADPGVLKSLLDIFVFMPSEDRMTFEEALRRGGVALAVRATPDRYAQAIDVLDRDGAIDLEEREITWIEDGWAQGGAAQAGTATPPVETSRSQDPLVDPGANADVRERIGGGTSDMTVGTDLSPPNAASPARRDTGHGRHRVRSYIGEPSAVPSGIDPRI